ncbi:MAG: indolepyruvate ferredoxin oxidoreductase subunit alpha [Planctomycetaceae bacterium]|nr:indolepyruvate ferredoxin oxidoreductase subunit alpha [Planctomycetaceae bacterium]
MSRVLLLGNEAFARGAYEAGITLASAYPGTPSTEILENIAEKYKDVIYAEWAPNEKVAFEVAAGASFAGARAMATMKHVGLNVAADPLMTLTYIGTVGGFVVVVADDPGMHSSQNEQDTRHFARFAKIPILEPADSQEAKDYIKLAVEISEEFSVPVIVRSGTRISHSRSLVTEEPRQESDKPIHFVKDPPRYVPIPIWGRPMRVKVEERLHKLRKYAETCSANNIIWQDKKLGIVTSGVAYQYVREVFPEASVLKLGMSYPFPDALIREFAAGVDELLIVEEMEDFLEEHIKAMGIACRGKDVVPNIGELSPDALQKAAQKSPVAPPPELPFALPTRPPVLCAGCPHRGIFYALTRIDDVIVAGDIGCYSLGVFPPLSGMDMLLCMGGGVTLAHGVDMAQRNNEKPQKIVGMVGDSTFFHSGITGLLDVAYNKGSSTIIVVDNRTTAMTGHQDHPGTGKTLMGEDATIVSIQEVGKACGFKNVRTVDPRDIKTVVAVLKEATESPEPWLIVSESPCPLHDRAVLGPPLTVSEKCTKCKLCLKLGCPGLEKTGDAVKINELLCAGCLMCKNVCPAKAIGVKASTIPPAHAS